MEEEIDYKKRNKEQREMSNLRDSFSTDTPADAIVQIIMIVGIIVVAFILGGSRYL